jgi:hypothetical protein
VSLRASNLGCRLVPNHIAGFAILYGIFLSFGVSLPTILACARPDHAQELGPGSKLLGIYSPSRADSPDCLGLLASKAIGPTAARGQLYGIAAAVGKVGAFIGTYTFPQIIESLGECVP